MMGMEIETKARQGRKSFVGKLYLDSKSLSFKSGDFRWSAELGDSLTAESLAEDLVIKQGKEKITFAIGKAVDRWVDKILNPPSRITKLGVKPGQKFWLSKGFEKSFAEELKQVGAAATRKVDNCQIAFWHVTHRELLSQFPELAEQLSAGVNIWIVWPKGSKAIGQNDVMNTARENGFGPSKTAAFDDAHSSMRFAFKK